MKVKLFAFFTAFLTACSVQAKDLIVYFSQPEKVDAANIDAYSGASAILKDGAVSGATEYLAKEIQKHTGAEMFRIETVQNYPIDTHQQLLDFAQEEQRKGIKPALKAKPELTGADRVFVGFPIWWYRMPMPLYTFFEENDFSGKKIVLFVSHGGSRFSGAGQEIRKMQPQAEVIEGFEAYLYKSTRADSAVEKRVESWLKTLDK